MRKLFILLGKKKGLVLTLILICIARSIVVVLLNKSYAELVDSILTGIYGLITGSTVLLLCTGAAQVGVIVSQYYISSILSEGVGYALRIDTIDGILSAEYRQVENIGTAECISKLGTDLSRITTWIKNDLSTLLSDGILFIVVLTAMLYMNWQLAVLSFCIVPFFSVGSYLLSKPITASEKEKNKTVEDVNVIAKSIVAAFPIFKLYHLKNSLLREVHEKINLSVSAEIKANKIRAKLLSINGFLSYIPTAIMWGFGGYMVIKGGLSAGALLAFINMSSFVRGPLLNLPARIDALRTTAANTARVFDLLEQITGKEQGKGAIMSEIKGANAIELHHVSFNYAENKRILEDVSFTVPKGSMTAIVGESGCGKSTILKLISGLYLADGGEILVFGSDVKSSAPDDIRSKISFVSQESQLFPVSILDNITCGHPISMDSVTVAFEAAQLTKFIGKLPDGIYTNTGECGNKISGGERQRICLARAFAKNAPLILLDEATSALDAETEDIILDYITKLKGVHTVVTITHKLKNAVSADNILCMKDGRILEAGTHAALMAAGGYYANLFKAQNMLEELSYENALATV